MNRDEVRKQAQLLMITARYVAEGLYDPPDEIAELMKQINTAMLVGKFKERNNRINMPDER